MTSRNIEIGIDRLVLEGFAADDGERIRTSVEQELTRLLADHGVPAGLAEYAGVTRLDGGEIVTGQGANGASVGTQIAESIYEAIKQ